MNDILAHNFGVSRVFT